MRGRRFVRSEVAALVVAIFSGCGDEEPQSAGPCNGLVVRVVTGSDARRPLAGVSLQLRGAAGSATTIASTDARGEGCAITAGLTAPYALTVFRRGYTLTSLIGLRGAVDGPVHVEPIRTDTRAPREITINVSGAPAGTAQIVADAADFETARGAVGLPLRSTLLPNDAAPFEVFALALDTRGSMLSVVSQNFGDRARLGDAVSLAFGEAPAIRTTRVVTAFSPGGILSTRGLRAGEHEVRRVVRGSHGTTGVVVGTSILSTLLTTGGNYNYELRTAGGEVEPTGAFFVFDPASVMARVVVWQHTFPETVTLEVPPVRRLALGGSAPDALTFSYDGDQWEHAAIQLIPRGSTQAVWQVFAVDASQPGELSTQPLPTGLTLADLGLTVGVETWGMLLRMREGRPWSVIPESTTEHEYAMTVATALRTL